MRQAIDSPGAGAQGGAAPVADGVRPDEVLDTVGLFCPVPILRTSERIRRMPAGGILEIRSDDRVILIDLPAWCRSHGHEYLGSRRTTADWRLFVRKA